MGVRGGFNACVAYNVHAVTCGRGNGKSLMGARFPVQTGGDGDDDVNVQARFDLADVVAPRAHAALVAFILDPGAVFDVDCASGVNAGVDLSVLMLTTL